MYTILDYIKAQEQVSTVHAFIRKEGSQYCVHSHQTRKNFGCYPSRKQAVRRLEQIKRFK